MSAAKPSRSADSIRLSEVHAGHVEEVKIKDREYTFRVHGADAAKTAVQKETVGPIAGRSSSSTRSSPTTKDAPAPKVYFEKEDTSPFWSLDAHHAPADALHRHHVLPLHAAAPGGRRQGDELRQGQGAHAQRLAEQGHVRRRRGHRRGEGRGRRDHRLPQGPEEVPAPRRPHPEGRAHDRPAGHRQDAPRARHRGRSGRAVLQHLRLGLRRDVRRRRREPRPRPLRAGQEARALHHLHRRDRRRRSSPRRGPRRRSRRARADAQPAPRRDGRLRVERGRHHHRGDQPPRRARSRRSCAPAASTAASPSRAPTCAVAKRSSASTRRARRSRRTSTSRSSRAARRASPAPTSRTSSTRPRSSPRARTRTRVSDGRLRAGQGQGPHGHRAPLDGHERRREAEHRGPRGRPHAHHDARTRTTTRSTR